MTSPIADRLGRLFRLQDLDIMLREMDDPKYKLSEEQMGFSLQALEHLRSTRQKLAETIDAKDLRLYERIAKKHVHGIVPVVDRICLGCHMTLPTSAVSLSTDPEQLLSCEMCGRILYWVD